jgi:hypothetical protein
MLLIRGSVLSGEAPFAVRAYYCLQIVVGVVGGIAGRAVADLQVQNLGGTADPAHMPGSSSVSPASVTSGMTLKNVDEFVLLGMRVPQCGLRSPARGG